MTQTFPCDRGNMCNTQPSQPVAYAQQADENIVSAFIKNINLSESQRYAQPHKKYNRQNSSGRFLTVVKMFNYSLKRFPLIIMRA